MVLPAVRAFRSVEYVLTPYAYSITQDLMRDGTSNFNLPKRAICFCLGTYHSLLAIDILSLGAGCLFLGSTSELIATGALFIPVAILVKQVVDQVFDYFNWTGDIAFYCRWTAVVIISTVSVSQASVALGIASSAFATYRVAVLLLTPALVYASGYNALWLFQKTFT